MSKKKLKVLLEIRPALDGFAGIPQEVRLLFQGLCNINSIEVDGLIQTSHKKLYRGTNDCNHFWKKISNSKKINRYSKVIVSMAEKSHQSKIEILLDIVEKKMLLFYLVLKMITGINKIKLTHFDPLLFKDFIWRTFFSKTLPVSDFVYVANAGYKICSIPWNMMHMIGLKSLHYTNSPQYPVLDTKDFDVFIGQTPYPGRVHPNTSLVIRYHDALPIFMPHTISGKSKHQATHFYALMSNVKSGAYFACVSESSRQDLIRIFPEVADRAVTIHNMVSDYYYREDSSDKKVLRIIRLRQHGDFNDKTRAYGLIPKFLNTIDKENFYKKCFGNGSIRYLLVVSTIEPRKNHTLLLAAWEVLKDELDPELKLIVVGTLGWDYKNILQEFNRWIDCGDLFLLSDVPASDLRVLYHHALATICPSFGEGFDFSGIESMCCGGITIASDIPAHTEIYADAAEYFDPYSEISLVNTLKKVLYEKESLTIREHMRHRGEEISLRYRQDNIRPKWENFLQDVVSVKMK